MSDKNGLRVAIIHDWLVGGGAERVVSELHKIYPDAPIYTSYCSDEWRKKLDGKVMTGYLQRWPFSRLRKFLPVLRLWWFKSLDLSSYDLIISSTGNGEAKHINVPKAAKYVSYCHSPVHFYWRHYAAYMKNPGFGFFNPIVRVGLRLLVSPLRRADFKAAQKVDHFIANSSHIQNDIKKFYKRDSTVIHPPVATQRFKTSSDSKELRILTVGRLVPNKRLDIVVEACNKLALKLVIVGRGPELASLKKQAGPTVLFDTSASDKKVARYMSEASAFIFSGHEDFGITPVESLAAGTPVIAYQAGGALDYVVEGKTGLFFKEQTKESLVEALKKFEKTKFDKQVLVKASEQFTEAKFKERFTKFINSL
jgi:glycosyltransferase involved in cell wall biosynthesis